MATGQLMFEVGVSENVKNLEKVKEQLNSLVENYSKNKAIQLKVEIDNLDAINTALSKIGDSPKLRELRQEIESLNREFSKLAAGAGGVGDLNLRAANQNVAELKENWQSANRTLLRYKTDLEDLRRSRDMQPVGSQARTDYQGQIATFKKTVEEQQKIADAAKSAYDKAVKDAGQLVDANTRAEASYRELKSSIDGLKTSFNGNVVGTDFANWAKEVQNVTASVRELVEQLQKMNTATSAQSVTETTKAQTQAVLEESDAYKQLAKWREQAEKFFNTNKPIADQNSFIGHAVNGIVLGDKTSLETIKQHIYLQKDENKLLAERKLLEEQIAKSNIRKHEQKTNYQDVLGVYDKVLNALQQIKQTEQRPTPKGGLFDPQKFTTLQEAIDKIISEINRLQQAFTRLGENSSLSNLSTMINGLAVTLSSLSNAIKIQPLDDQVKALLERCEKAEAKLREVGDAAKYLNERAGAKTQQKAGTIMDITGTEAEQLNKVSSTAERFARLLVEIENQMAKIGKIQAFGEQSGFSPTLLKNAQNQLEALHKMVESTIKGTPIAEGLVIPASNSQLAQFIQQFGLLKAEYRDIIKEADRFNKINEKDSLKQKNEELRAAASNMKEAANESRRLTETISNLEALASKAGALGIDISKLRNVIDNLKGLRILMDDVAKTNSHSTKDLKLEERFFQLKRDIKNVAREIKKEMSAALKPDTEQANAFKEYISLLKQITSLTGTAKRAEALGIDTQTLRNQIALLENYAKIIERFVGNKGVGFNAWMQATPVYGEARGNIAADQAKMNKEITDAKQTNTHATLQLSESEQRLANAVKGTSDSMRGQSQVLSDLKMLATQYLSVWGAQSLVGSIIETGGLLEQQRLSLSAILGDMGKAQTLFNQIKTMALKSPFGVVELDKMSKQLAAYSFEYEELFEWTKRLADISAATGTSVDRLALALGHVRSEGALSGYTLRQFAMANVPVLRMLSENLGISSKEVRERVRKKDISAEDVQDILKQLTEDGGMFANAQETMSEALNAKFKNLRDAFDIMYGEIAESGVGDKLKNLAEILTAGAKHWERLATDVKDVAIAFGIGKVAILMYNNALGKGTAITLKSALAAKQREIANLELTASYRQLTTSELATMANAGKLNATNIATLLSTKKLTYAELERAVALGKVDKAVALAALDTLGMHKQMALLRSVAPLQGFARMWAIVAYNIKLAGAAVKSFLASAWPLLALTAAFEVWNRRSEQKDNASDMAKATAGNARGREAYEIRDSLADSRKLSSEALKQNIAEMQNALTAANAYTDELKKQIDATDDLAKKYDLLKVKIGEVADAYEEQKAAQESMMKDAWDAGGGFFYDNMLEDTKQFDTAMAEYQKKLTIASKQIKGILSEWLRNQGQFKEEFASMTGKQIFETLTNDMQESFLNYAWNAKGLDTVTSEMLRGISTAYNKVGDKLSEMRGEQGEEFASIMKSMYEEAFKVDLDHASEEQKIAFDKWLRETLARAEGLSKDAKEALRNIVIDFTIKLVPHYQVEKPQTAQDVIDQQIGDNKWLSGFFGRQNNSTQVWTVETAQKEVKKYKKLFGDISLSNLDTAPKKLNSLLDGLEETKKNLQNTLSNGLLSSDEKEDIEKSLKETTDSIDLANKALKDVGGKRQKKGDKSGNKNYDTERAKAVREQVRVIKEAADAFQYWRDKVGDKGAWEHVQKEFGDVLAKIGITANNIEDVRGHLKKIPQMKEYQAITDKKVKTEIDKEIAKDNDQFIRKDFERDTKKYVSQLTLEIEELTRKWEIFNSVRNETGDSALAQRLTGITPGATPADLKRYNVASFAGVDIDFDSVLQMSDEQIDRYVEKLGVPEEKIEAIRNGLKDWKKAQKDIITSDIQNYAKWLGSLVDLQSIQTRNQNEYNQTLEETNRLLKEGKITQEEADRRKKSAAVTLDTKNWQSTMMYSRLYDNALMMATSEFNDAYAQEMKSLNDQMKAGTLTAKDYADKVSNLNEIAKEFSIDGFLGLKGGVGAFLSGGNDALIQYYNKRAKDARMRQAFYQQAGDKKNAKNSEDEAKKYEGLTVSLVKVTEGAKKVFTAFQGLSNGIDMVADLFANMGDSGTAETLGDVGSVFGSALSGASSLSMFGPYGMAAGAAIGLVSGIFALQDKSIQREIDALKENVAALEENTQSIKDYRQRTLGYDEGKIRKSMADTYITTIVDAYKEAVAQGHHFIPIMDSSQFAMAKYYATNYGMSGYQAELENLKALREDYRKMYKLEHSKKNVSDEALREYTKQIAELDEQIFYFTEDLANELWGIDFKAWASQISDALWTAFENGESALEAFHDTARDIISDVAKRMMNIHLIEPVFNKLEERLFGKIDENGVRTGGVYNETTGQFDENETLRILGEFFGEDGEFAKVVESAEDFYKMAERVTGFDLSDDGGSSSSSKTIKGITEQTADLLASYVSAIRLDVSVIRTMDAKVLQEYWPSQIRLMTAGTQSLTNIEQHTLAIMRSNDVIAERITNLDNNINGLKSKTWSIPIA